MSAVEVVHARTLWSRLKGLIGTREWPVDRALCIRPCSSVHTAFMRYPTDVVFVDRGGRVLKVVTLMPWRMAAAWRAAGVLELAAGRAQHLGWRPGVTLPPAVWNSPISSAVRTAEP